MPRYTSLDEERLAAFRYLHPTASLIKKHFKCLNALNEMLRICAGTSAVFPFDHIDAPEFIFSVLVARNSDV